jgi:competence ComEA-like helix-hairpin-helix protein
MENDMSPIDLNQATSDELAALPGIGQALAQRILTYRETVHPFEEVIELAAVPGISERMLRRFQDQVTVASVAADVIELEGDAAPSELDQNLLLEEETAGLAPILETEEMAGPDSHPSGDLSSKPDAEPETDEEDESIFATEADREENNAEAPEEEATPEDAEPSQVSEATEEEEVGSGDPLAEAPPAPPRSEVEPAIASISGSLQTPGQTPATPDAALISDRDSGARRRGCIVLLLGAVLGALIGTVVTLAIIASLNGGELSFSRADARLMQELDDVNQEQARLIDRLESMESQLGDVTTTAAETAESQADTEEALGEIYQDLASVEQDLSRLENATDAFEERLTTVALAAQTFESFLNRLRDLLIDIQGPPPTAVPSPTATNTYTPVPADTPESEEMATLEASPDGTGSPTRTPRPTTTPFPIVTGTPEPQP